MSDVIPTANKEPVLTVLWVIMLIQVIMLYDFACLLVVLGYPTVRPVASLWEGNFIVASNEELHIYGDRCMMDER